MYGLAGSREQARIAQRFANGFLEQSELAAWLTPGATIRCPLNGGFYSLLSSDGRLGQGVMPSAALVDEWWVFEHEREREAFNALARALHERPGEAWLLATTTAGFSKGSQLRETYERALKHSLLEEQEDGFLQALADEESGFLLHWYGAPPEADIEDPATIRAANPASWLRPGDLLRELNRPDTDELDWRRSISTSGRRRARPGFRAGSGRAWPRRSRSPGGDLRRRRRRLDARLDRRLLGGETFGRAHLPGAKFWTTDEGSPGEYVPGGRMELALVEAFIRQLASNYRLRELAYDPSYFGRSAQELERAGIETVEFIPDRGSMRQAWQATSVTKT